MQCVYAAKFLGRNLAKVLIAGFAIVFWQCSAVADTSDDAASSAALKKLSLEELSNVEITSVSKHPEKLSRAASAIQVITAEDIRRSGASSIPEALRLADNLDVAQKNSHDWAISARGFNTALANKLLVLIDGRTVYTPLFSGVFWDTQNYLLADIDRIEVISGPGGALWGANAVNGVINIITKSAKDTQGEYLEAGGGAQLQDFAGARYGATVAPETYFRVYGDFFNRNNEVLANTSAANDAWDQGQGGFRLDSRLSPTDLLTVQGDYYRGDEDVVSGSTAHVSGGNILGRWSHTVSDLSDMNLQIYYDRTHLLDPIAAFAVGSTILAPSGFLTDDLDTYDIDFQHRFVLNDSHQLEWGLGYRRTRDSLTNAPALAFYPAILDQDLYSGFVQDEITLASDWLLTIGTKLEHNGYTGFEWEPSVRIQWALSDSQTLWSAISRAVRTPSRVDRDISEPASSFPPVVLEGADDYRSEDVIAYEVGYRAELTSSLTGAISTFYNYYTHVRSTSVTPVTFLPLYFQNNVEGHTYGLELSANYQVLSWWRLHAGYDPIKEDLHVKPGQFDFNAALNEIADPHQRFLLLSSMDLPNSVELDGTLRWIDKRDINTGSKIGTVPSYTELDLRVGWHATEKLELSLVGQNLLQNRHAEYGYPGPTQVQIERTVFGKIAWHF